MRLACLVVALATALAAPALAAQAAPQRNVVIFVADGLRYGIVSPETAPTLAAVQREGVDFRNSHSLYPTITTPNASAIATGHRIGDTGDFGNAAYLGTPAVPSAFGSLTPSYEDDAVLGDANARFGGNYLGEESLLAMARAHGFSTAAIGKLGPTAIQDVTQRDAAQTIIIDDKTGAPGGLHLRPEIVEAIKTAGLPTATPDRGANGEVGAFDRPGARVPNRVQQDWLTDVATKVVLPRFKAAGKPFVLVFWSRDPDGTQHGQGDSLNTLSPGINGPTTLAAIRNASDDLQRLREALKGLGLDATTDIVVTADHGFDTVSKQSATSGAAKRTYRDVPPGFLPPGFLAIDLAQALNLPLYEPGGVDVDLDQGGHPKSGSAILGADVKAPKVVIAANGGSDMIWLPNGDGPDLAARIVGFLATQDYASAMFVDDALGPIPGTLPLSAVSLDGSARAPRPQIVVSFKTTAGDCANPEICALLVADTGYQQGQGSHGALARSDTRNFMAAVGPDFKAGFADPAPVSNADWVPTLARILGLPFVQRGHTGRAMSEALVGGAVVEGAPFTLRSAPAANGFVTILEGQRVGDTPYFDAAGSPGRTVGLRE